MSGRAPQSSEADHRGGKLTVDELARAAGTTTRQVRALQTRGLLPHPALVGRTGYYGGEHLDRLRAIVRLQRAGFSLAALETLLRAWEANRSVAEVLGLPPGRDGDAPDESDVFGDAALALVSSSHRRGRLLSLVPSTILGEPAAS